MSISNSLISFPIIRYFAIISYLTSELVQHEKRIKNYIDFKEFSLYLFQSLLMYQLWTFFRGGGILERGALKILSAYKGGGGASWRLRAFK